MFLVVSVRGSRAVLVLLSVFMGKCWSQRKYHTEIYQRLKRRVRAFCQRGFGHSLGGIRRRRGGWGGQLECCLNGAVSGATGAGQTSGQFFGTFLP